MSDEREPEPERKPRSAVLWTLVIELSGTVSGALIFWLLARLFDPELYGLLGGLMAIGFVAGPVASFGAGALMAQRLANDPDASDHIGEAVGMTLVGTVAASLVVTAIQPFLFDGVDRLTVLIFLLGQVSAFWIAELAVYATLALGRQRLGAWLRIITAIVRLAGFAVYAALAHTPSLRGWAWATLATGLVSAVLVHLGLGRSIGQRLHLRVPSARRFRTGFPFGISTTVEGFLDATDRPVLLHYDFRAGAGIYSAAYRIVGLSYVPMLAVIRSFDREVWRAGEAGLGEGYRQSRRIIALTLPMSVVAAATMYFSAPYVVQILPGSYAEAAPSLRWLAVLPAIKSVQFPLGNALTTSGLAALRLKLTGAAAMLNFALNLWWIPRHSWRGAAAATVLAETALALLLFVVARRRGPSSTYNAR